MPPATLVVLRAEQPPSLPNRFAVDHDRPIKRNAGLVNRARPSQYDAEHGQTDSSAAFSKSRDPPGGHSPGRAGSVTSPPPSPAGRGAFRRPPRSRRRNPPRSSPGRTGKRHVTAARPPPAGRGASRHRRPPHSSMRSAIPLMSDTLRRRHLTRRQSASRPEAAGPRWPARVARGIKSVDPHGAAFRAGGKKPFLGGICDS